MYLGYPTPYIGIHIYEDRAGRTRPFCEIVMIYDRQSVRPFHPLLWDFCRSLGKTNQPPIMINGYISTG